MRHAVNVLVSWALLLPLFPRVSASATLGDTVIRARLPAVRSALVTDYVCTAVALPADPLKLVKVVPAAVGTATDMLLYGVLTFSRGTLGVLQMTLCGTLCTARNNLLRHLQHTKRSALLARLLAQVPYAVCKTHSGP